MAELFYKTCEYCGVHFTTVRSDARYHSPSCRASAWRQRKQLSNHEPIAGLRGNFALAADWLYACSPEALRIVALIRKARGLHAAEYAIVAAIAVCYPGIEDITHEHHAFYDKLLDKDARVYRYPNQNLATEGVNHA